MAVPNDFSGTCLGFVIKSYNYVVKINKHLYFGTPALLMRKKEFIIIITLTKRYYLYNYRDIHGTTRVLPGADFL